MVWKTMSYMHLQKKLLIKTCLTSAHETLDTGSDFTLKTEYTYKKHIPTISYSCMVDVLLQRQNIVHGWPGPSESHRDIATKHRITYFKRCEGDSTAVKGQTLERHLCLFLEATPFILPLYITNNKLVINGKDASCDVLSAITTAGSNSNWQEDCVKHTWSGQVTAIFLTLLSSHGGNRRFRMWQSLRPA